MDEWIKNMWYTYTKEYYSTPEKKEKQKKTLPFATT